MNIVPGPAVTLYELALCDGTRITKVRNLEDDLIFALGLTGIRIVAPIEEKGTIGVEIPNDNPNIVSLRDIVDSQKFKESTMELPIALGKTFDNKEVIVDLADIPQLLVGGATGQGKSVFLHDTIISLLYKKRPDELKLVLIDPKKIEFDIYEPIAKHYLASRQINIDNPIIAQPEDAVRTLEGLVSLMNERFDMLKQAGVRNIREYNELRNSENKKASYSPMPYIVVIIDEFGDLIMTVGKEIEIPIINIAQIGRAIGIHMVIATQRPTTKIISGIIKANFPGRMAFRVASQIDSRLILDRTGAEQLVGNGDMLFLNGSESIRVQCANVEISDIENVARFISGQTYTGNNLIIPKSIYEAEGAVEDDNDAVRLPKLDPLFINVAVLVVNMRKCSVEYIQSMFSIGVKRAHRILSQLHEQGIVGEEKSRDVLVDEEELNKIIVALKDWRL